MTIEMNIPKSWQLYSGMAGVGNANRAFSNAARSLVNNLDKALDKPGRNLSGNVEKAVYKYFRRVANLMSKYIEYGASDTEPRNQTWDFADDAVAKVLGEYEARLLVERVRDQAELDDWNERKKS